MRAGLRLAAAMACLSSAQLTSGQAPLRLLVQGELPQGVAERIAGQIADLPWSTEQVAADGAGVARAEVLAAERGARAVIWVEEDAGGFALRLFDAGKRRLLQRRFPRARAAGGEPLARSAALESLALAVRSALRALSDQEEVGDAVEERDATRGGVGTVRTPDRASENGQARQRTPPEPNADANERAGDADEAADASQEADAHAHSHTGTVALIAGVTWIAALDGQSPILHGPSARAGIGWKRLELAVEGQLGLPAELRDEQTLLKLRRSAALATASLELVRDARLSLALAAGFGIAWFARDTRTVAAGLGATDARVLRTFASELELRARLRLASTAKVELDLELGAGALLLSSASTLRYESDEGRVEHQLWRLAPHVRLGPCLRIGL